MAVSATSIMNSGKRFFSAANASIWLTASCDLPLRAKLCSNPRRACNIDSGGGATFTRGNARLDFEISDTKGASGMVESLAAMAGANFHRTLDTGYMKGATVAGSPAIESWNSADRSGELSVLVKKRYIINIGGRGIDDASAMRTLAERMDLARLK